MRNEKMVVLGLSGGVDSAVAAQTLAAQGFAVHCVYLDNGVGSDGREASRRVAGELGLDFSAISIEKELKERVCEPFYRAYLRGETPSPCALCNPTVKFPALLNAADALGAQWVATGHYARTAPAAPHPRADCASPAFPLRSPCAFPAPEGRLLRAGQPDNDQSYLLARLTRKQLGRVLFPLGNFNKSQVRKLAEAGNLSVAARPDSMEICFIPDDDYGAWLESYGPTPPEGDFVDQEGRVLGRHRGIHRYTLGQGRGLGVSGPHRYYVSAICPERNRITLSDGTDLFTRRVVCRELNYLSLEGLTGPVRLTARFRHSKGEVAVTLSPGEGGLAVAEADEAVRAPTPGQLAVFYDGEAVACSGWIV